VEPTKANKSANIIILAVLVILVAAPLLIWMYRVLHTTRLSQFVRSDLPVLDLELRFIDSKGQKVKPEQTKLGDSAAKEKEKTSEPSSEGCPELIGGDTSERTQLSEKEKRGEGCPKTAMWQVKRHPIGFSLYFQEPKKVLSLLEDNTRVNELFQTKFFQGLLYEPLHNANIRAEDLNLEGFEGAFLRRFFREALEAHSELHYDIVHGKKGFVFSFVRDECAFVSKALPIMARVLARSGYRVSKLQEPILEMRIGLQRLFLTEYKDRVYLANGLEALINVLESLTPSQKGQPKTPLVLTVRSEAFVGKLLPVMVGAPTWEVKLGFGLSEEAPGVLQFAGGKLGRPLRPKIFRGVLAGIPQDVFAALVTSYYLPPQMTAEEWQRLATQGPAERKADGPEEAGFAIVWDFDAAGDRLTNVGVVIANQKTPDELDKFKSYFVDPKLTTECGGGTVFLAATSPTLLARMKESCGGQSLSVLDWERGGRRKDYEAAQLFLFMNPGGGMRELFLAGGAKSGEAGEFEPQWKREYEQAKETMRQDGEKIFGGLPIFAYSGNAAPTAEVVQLKGFTVRQGASR
jgi:hypothetical protein